MATEVEQVDEGYTLPKPWMWTLIGISLLPSVLVLLTAPFGISLFADTFAYAILQISGFCVAVFVAILCLIHFSRTGEVTTPVLGVGMLCVGAMDLWQILAADLVVAPPEVTDRYIALSWTMSRGLYALVLVVGASISPLSEKLRTNVERKRALQVVAVCTTLFLCISGIIMYLCISKPDLALTLYADGFARNAWDLVPLVLLLFAGLYILPTYFLWHHNVFSQVLIISCIPLAMGQMHFALLSTELFDAHFGVANFLKLLGYLIPLVGLLIDYEKTYRDTEKANKDIQNELLKFEQSQAVSRRSVALLDILMDTLTDPVCMLDSSLRATQLNRVHATISGMSTPLLAIGKGIPALVGTELAPEHEAACREVMKTGERSLRKARMATYPDGQPHHFAWLYAPVRDAQGAVIAIACVGRETLGR